MHSINSISPEVNNYVTFNDPEIYEIQTIACRINPTFHSILILSIHWTVQAIDKFRL